MARPREFEYDEVLKDAMNAFWKGGYHATSMGDIEEATGLRRGSLYKVFKDKKAIYLATIDHYGKAALDVIKALSRELDVSPRETLRGFFDQTASDPEFCNKGCFLVNTIVEVSAHDQEIAKRTRSLLDQYVSAISKIIRSGQELGEFDAGRPAKEMARLVVFTMSAVRVAKKNGEPDEVGKSLIKMLFDQISV